MIVVTRCRGMIGWYDSDPDFWILDQRKWAEAFVAAGHEVDPTDFSHRFGIAIVDESTAVEFLEKMSDYAVPQDTLRARLETAAKPGADWFDVAEYLPVLFVDFDARKLWSIHPESTSFVDHVPDGWAAAYEDFFGEPSGVKVLGQCVGQHPR